MANVAQGGRSMGAYLSRFFLAMRAGMSFGTARDVYKVFGYPRKLTAEMLRERVLRQDIVKTCLYKPAEAIWTRPPIMVGSEELVAAWNTFVRQSKLWSVMLRADKMLGVEPYVVLFLGLPGASERAATKATKVSYIQPYGHSAAAIQRMEQDAASERYGQPLNYTLQAAASSGAQSLNAHWTRCVHLTNELTDENNSSAPRILAAYNLFDDIAKVTGGAAETFWLTANRGMQVDVDKEMELDTDEANALSDELDEFQHQLRRYIRTRGVKITSLGSDVADPRGVFDVLVSLLSGTYGIPQRVLMGSEAGQLASEQDRANWAQVIDARRTSVAEPYMLLPVVERLMALGILPNTEDFSFQWPDAFQMSPLESAQTMAQSARAIVNLSRQAQYGTPVSTLEEARLICNLPAAPAEGESYPVTPTKEGSLKSANPGKEGAATEGEGATDTSTTAITGEDEGNDGIADKKKGTKGKKEAEAKANLAASEVFQVLGDLSQRFSVLEASLASQAAAESVTRNTIEVLQALPGALKEAVNGQNTELLGEFSNKLETLAANLEFAARTAVERPVQVTVHQEPTQVTVTQEAAAAPIHHHHIQVAAAEAPQVQVDVHTPEVVVQNTVEQPAITVLAPEVTVQNNVEVPAAKVTLEMPTRVTETSFTRDGKNEVSGSRAVERTADDEGK